MLCSAADTQKLCPSLHEDLNLTQQDAIPDQYPEDIIMLDRLEVNIISQTKKRAHLFQATVQEHHPV